MSAVLRYFCTCGTEYLISIREIEREQEDVLSSASWERTIEQVAHGLGSRYVDRRDTPVFVCDRCDTAHARV